MNKEKLQNLLMRYVRKRTGDRPEYYEELRNLLMRYSHLGVDYSKNGALLIGKAPHIASLAWLNTMYPCVTEKEVADLEKQLKRTIPDVYKEFLTKCSNGLSFMVSRLDLYGIRTSNADRSDFSLRFPYGIQNVEVDGRPENATDNMFFFGTYGYDCSKLYLDRSDNKVYYCARYDATPLKSWDSFSEMLRSEIERIYGLFDDNGHEIDKSVLTIPVVPSK